VWSASCEHGCAKSADAERDAEEHPGDHPEACGISSCANTMIDEVADERMRPMKTVSTALAARPA